MRRAMIVLTLILMSALLLLLSFGQGRPPEASRERQALLPIESTIEPLARAMPGGNTVLRVRFAEGSRLPARIPYATESGIVVLADDGVGFDAKAGDGLYAALGTMDLVAFRERLVRLSESKSAMPVRTWQTRSKTPVDAKIDPARLRPGQRMPWEWWGDATGISQSRSLMVTHLGAVEDGTRTSASCGQPSMGKWSFGYLMEQMANTPATGVTGSQFTQAWLERWLTAQPVNGWSVHERTLMQARILDPWIAASGGPGTALDLSKAPFKLLAIVNRVDLRDQVAYGGGSGGELRFVFAHLDGACSTGNRPFEVILEFGVPVSGCLDVKAWAAQWKALDTLALGSPAYNAALEAITEQVVVANAAPGKPNGSALNQIRTNENRLDDTGDGLDWEVREFRIDAVTHLPFQDTLAQTPGAAIKWSPTLPAYVDGHAWSIKNGTYTVPLRYPAPADPFRGGGLVYGIGSPWGNTVVDREARHRFSLNTCNGCHTGETFNEFTHVKPRPFGTEAALSGFMTGIWVDDPLDHSPARFFDDLQRRAVDMDALLNTSCFVIPLDLPLLAAPH